MEDLNIDALCVSWTCEMWMALGADPIVASQIIEMVMEKLAIMAPYADKKESMIRGGTVKVATNQPLAVSYKNTHRHHVSVCCPKFYIMKLFFQQRCSSFCLCTV